MKVTEIKLIYLGVLYWDTGFIILARTPGDGIDSLIGCEV